MEQNYKSSKLQTSIAKSTKGVILRITMANTQEYIFKLENIKEEVEDSMEIHENFAHQTFNNFKTEDPQPHSEETNKMLNEIENNIKMSSPRNNSEESKSNEPLDTNSTKIKQENLEEEQVINNNNNTMLSKEDSGHSSKLETSGDKELSNTKIAKNSQENPKQKRRQRTRHQLECDECSKKFSQFSLLIRHIRTHTKEKPFKCRKCGQRFNHTGHLRRHELHSIKCGTCGRKCPSHGPPPSDMNLPQCQYCQKIFRYPSQLDEHLVKHVKNENIMFKCDFCQKRYFRKNMLIRHIVKVCMNKYRGTKGMKN